MSIPPNLTPVRAGFIPLVDCAVLVAAREKGFAAEQGIDLQLFKEVSWANIRDRINIGQFDVAHMLAGMPIAQSLGINHIKLPMIAPMALSSGGNAITVSCALYSELRDSGENLRDPLGAAKALRHVVEQRRELGDEPLSFGQVFPFSCHNYQLRYWMAAAGIDPENDVRLAVIPPPYMVKSLESGQVDGFCVGEPWNSQAADQGLGVILAHTMTFWPSGPEKVLGLQAQWAEGNPQTLNSLLVALHQAARWVEHPDNRSELAAMLSRPAYLGVSETVVTTALRGDVRFYENGAVQALPEHAMWLYAQMVRWGQVGLSPDAEEIVRGVYRPDLLADALNETVETMAEAPSAPLDGVAFNPIDVAGYISAQAQK